ncbi:hypothetical protein [Actinoplanes awajinensis]|uniref:DUF3040 domain-containing protein n=1 Tax=Actinoplanes awajinensis subsp. mycoplanecinus TaxID=135947 RepID=A0A101J8V6_9ACTN|nr:hypothetical protein [Actinoplanes awajinensis]KUL22380.1 hypothetical protein ADL15_48475 [Actinoplanes awajinensis subsp. mycoplanecinus]
MILQLSTRDTRREFDQIVARLTGEEVTPIRRTRKPLRTVTIASLAVIAGLVWAGLSVLMVVWGAVGVLITGLVVAAAVATAVAMTRRR